MGCYLIHTKYTKTKTIQSSLDINRGVVYKSPGNSIKESIEKGKSSPSQKNKEESTVSFKTEMQLSSPPNNLKMKKHYHLLFHP